MGTIADVLLPIYSSCNGTPSMEKRQCSFDVYFNDNGIVLIYGKPND